VWIPDADAGGFSPGTVQATTATGARTCRTLDGRELTVKRGVALDALKKSSLSKNVPDLVQLDSITPGQIAHNLKTRFENNEIYTSVGTILISINPYKMLPIYTPSKIQVCGGGGHVFGGFF
jgi:myosin heavy subunit